MELLSLLGQALSHLRIMGKGERQPETQIDRGTDVAGDGEAFREREKEEKQGDGAGEERWTAETYQTHKRDAAGEDTEMAGRGEGSRARGTGRETEGEDIDESKIKQKRSFEKTGQRM